ncbi:VOC family protein [Streptomyces sp. NL15-2K]|uniref:VOC family protein n=1 Tax=Streptomyces sp. NL15-2K TaxID=376149 RepID=UPI000F55CF51
MALEWEQVVVDSADPVGLGRWWAEALHLDFRPDDQAAEVARFLALGARQADVGQGEQRWVTLADPEGNEFCVLGERLG